MVEMLVGNKRFNDLRKPEAKNITVRLKQWQDELEKGKTQMLKSREVENE